MKNITRIDLCFRNISPIFRKFVSIRYYVMGPFKNMRYLWIILWCVLAIPLMAQRIRVEDFGQYKKPFLRKAPYITDKRFALFDLVTNEKGFEFTTGTMSVEATEGEGVITLALPHKCDFLTIKHPIYGQYTWKAPKALKRKKHYHAYLYTESLEKEYQQEKQWALLTVWPERAIVYMDSVMYPVQDGQLSLYLPIGKHACRIESPFYKPLNDTIELTDSARFEKRFVLESFYAYLTVETDLPDTRILLDGKPMGFVRAETGRLCPGRYRLTIEKEDRVYYDRLIEIANAERKVIDLRGEALYPLRRGELFSEQAVSLPDSSLVADVTCGGEKPSVPVLRGDTVQASALSDVHITAFDAETEIWLNRELVGRGEWRGQLALGFYSVSSRKEGLESRTDFFWVESKKALELNLISPKADYGLLNISCNEVNATVSLNGLVVGFTPCVLRDLPINRTYRIQLVKGRKKAERVIHLRGNDIMNLSLELK